MIDPRGPLDRAGPNLFGPEAVSARSALSSLIPSRTVDDAPVLRLIQTIYEASLDTGRWQDFIDGLSEAYGGAHAGIALQHPGFPLSSVFFVAGGFESRYRELFAEHVRRGLPWERARRKHFVGRFGLATEVVDEAQIEASEFYREWMEPQGIGPHGPIGHTIALEEGRPAAGLAIFTPAGRGAFTEADLVLGNQLVPHLALAYRIQTESRRHQALSDALDRFPTGVVLLDARGHVLRKNFAARSILELDDGLSERDGQLRAADPDEDGALRALVEQVIESVTQGTRGEGHVRSVSRRSGGRPFPLLVSPLKPRAGDPTLVDAVAVVYMSSLEGGALRHGDALRELYGLTEAESHLVELLCQGCSLEEAAHTRGVTMNTARSQLKQVFAKTHTSRQSELVRLVLSGVASIGGP